MSSLCLEEIHPINILWWRIMKGKLVFSVNVLVPRERKNIMYLGPASKDGDRSIAAYSLKLNVPSTVIK
jgi:hypothetical protein